MKIKKGDIVIVIAGKDRGKSGAVLRVLPKKGRVLVEGVNMVKKHQKSRRRGQQGQIVIRPTPVDVSNVLVKDPKTGRPTRVGYRTEAGKKVRVAKQGGGKV